MKSIFFLYRTPRQKLLEDIEKGIEPNQMLYGFWYLKKWGYPVTFSDDSYKRFWLFNLLLQPLQRLFITFTSFGFKLDQAIVLIAQIKTAEVVISTADSAGLPVLFLKKMGLLKSKIVYISTGLINELVLRNNPLANFCKSLFNSADLIITHSQAEKIMIKKIVKKEVVFVPFGIDYKYFSSEKSFSRENFILAIGHDRSRDYTFLAKVAYQLPRLKFLIVTHKNNIEGIVFPKNVEFLFNIPYSEVNKLYSQVSLVFLPLKEMSRASGQLSFLESIAAHKKVVVSETRGLKEVYPDVVTNVFYYHVNDIQSAITQIKNALKTRTINTRFPLKYSSENYAKKIETIINNLT